MRKNYISLLLVTGIIIFQQASAQFEKGTINQWHAQNKTFLELKDVFATSGRDLKPPLPQPPSAAAKPTAMRARVKAMYEMEFDGAQYQPSGDSAVLFWSGTRGAGIDPFYAAGMAHEVYMLQFPVSYHLFDLQHRRLIYQYDSLHVYFWNMGDGYYSDLESRDVQKLNSAGWVTESIRYEYDAMNSIWESDWRTTNTYEDDTLLIQTMGQEWDGAVWENEILMEYLYDGGKLVEIKQSEWAAGPSAWVNRTRDIFGYDGNNIVSIVERDWDPIGATWENTSRYLYTYANGNRTIDIRQHWTGTVWKNDNRRTYTFDAEGRVTEVELEEWDGTQWKPDHKYTVTYNSAGDIERWLGQESNGGVWENFMQFDYEYISNNVGTLHRIISKTWDDVNSVWKNYRRYLIQYNSYGLVSEFSMENWDFGGFWDTPVGMDKMIYRYEEFEDGTGVVDTDNEVQVLVYPNPADDRIVVEGTGLVHLRLIDLNGRLMWQSKVPLQQQHFVPTAQLTPGIYMLRMETSKGVVVSRPVVVQH